MCILLAELTELQARAKLGDGAAMRVLDVPDIWPRSPHTDSRPENHNRCAIPEWTV